MTIGDVSYGGPFEIGSFFSKSWVGDDYPDEGPNKANTIYSSVLYDMDGNILNRFTSDRSEVARAIIRNKASRVKRGFVKRQPIPHPYSMNYSKGYQPSISSDQGHGPYTFGYLFGNPGIRPAWTDNDELALINKLRSAVQGSDFNLGVFLAEAPEAVRMIGDAAERLANGIRAFKRGRILKAASILTKGRNIKRPHRITASSNWLELQYGWLPLVNDMDSGARYLAHKFNSKPLTRVKVSRSVVNEFTDNLNESPLFRASSDSWSFTRKRIIANLREVDQVQLSGLTDPASVAWELLPWSFVIDWAIPIGDYLSARSVVGSLKAEFIITTVTKSYFRPDRDVVYSGPRWVGAESYWHSWGTMSREVTSTLTVPFPKIKPLSEILSWKRAANAVALLLQQR